MDQMKGAVFILELHWTSVILGMVIGVVLSLVYIMSVVSTSISKVEEEDGQ